MHYSCLFLTLFLLLPIIGIDSECYDLIIEMLVVYREVIILLECLFWCLDFFWVCSYDVLDARE